MANLFDTDMSKANSQGMSDGGSPRWVERGNLAGSEGSGGATRAALAAEEAPRLSSPAAGAPVEKLEMVDYLVQAMGADVR